jgi:hypothetical protein
MEPQHILTLVNDISDAIKTTGSTLHKASNALKETTEKSVGTLAKSIDDFRKSNKRTSNVLIWLTSVLAFATLVQAVYVITLIFKK